MTNTNVDVQRKGNGDRGNNRNHQNGKKQWVRKSAEERLAGLRERLATLLLAPQDTAKYRQEVDFHRGAVAREERTVMEIERLRALPYAEAVSARGTIEEQIATVRSDLERHREECRAIVADADHVADAHTAFDAAVVRCVEADAAFQKAKDDATRDAAGLALAEARAALLEAKKAWDPLSKGERQTYAKADRAQEEIQVAERRVQRDLDRLYEQLRATPRPDAQQQDGKRRTGGHHLDEVSEAPHRTQRQARLFKDGTRGAVGVGQGIRSGASRAATKACDAHFAAKQAVARAAAKAPVPEGASHVNGRGELVTTPFAAALAAAVQAPDEASASAA